MDYVVIGAGPAGVTTAENLRKLDPAGTVTLVGEELETPYSRMAIPYYLIGKVPEEGTHLRRDPGHYDKMGIYHVQKRVSKLDSAAKTLTLDDGSTLAYDKLCISTGAHPVMPPIEGLNFPGVHTCWTLRDARAISKLAVEGAHVVLLGAGFIGSIVLEALALSGVKLTVVEMGDRMVPRMMDETSGGLLKQWCVSKGVDVRTGTKIDKIARMEPTVASDGAGHTKPGFFKKLFNGVPTVVDEPVDLDENDTLAVHLSDGHVLTAHLVVISAGVRSNTEFLKDSGLELDQGILVDDHLRTNLPDVWAAGDVAQGRDITTNTRMVHAIQPTATEHGRIAAQNMTGTDAPYQGSLNMNVLDTLGLISSSFGNWQGAEGGDSVKMVDADNYRYLRLEFDGPYLVGAQALGMLDHVGVLRGLIQSRTDLTKWKPILLEEPQRVVEAYVASTRLP